MSCGGGHLGFSIGKKNRKFVEDLPMTIPGQFGFNCPKVKVITKLPNSEQSYKGKVKTHNYINRQNQSTTGKL
jgi:hypothetical protein